VTNQETACDHRPVLLSTHLSASDVGEIVPILDRAGIPHRTLRLNKGDELPIDRSACRGIVTYGGFQSANDDHLDYIAAELRWLEAAIGEGFPVFGICLGAQMVARALGAEVRRHETGLYEFGWYPVEPVGDDAFGLGGPLTCYHRHGEVFDLPAGARLTATRETCPNQGFSFGENVIATQFHPEVNSAVLTRWLDRPRPLPDEDHEEGVQDIAGQLEAAPGFMPAVHTWLEALVLRWLAPGGE